MSNNYNKKLFFLIYVSWTLVIALSFLYNYQTEKDNNRNTVLEAARSFFQEIVTTREWNASHGGVYVKISDKAQPNPYLDVENRDLTANDSIKLTMINPAYMTRQISEITNKKNNILYHITSLNPIRPANKPDHWESDMLKDFEKGKEEGFSEQIYHNKRYYRYMAPLKVKQACLNCHAKQGYKLGEVRGGISISIPGQKYDLAHQEFVSDIQIVHLSLLFIGYFGIFLFNHRISKQYKIIDQTNNELKNINKEKEKQLKKNIILNEELDLLVKERTQQLEEARDELENFLESEKELNQMKSRFINIIYHEFKTPLTVVLSSSEIIKVIIGEDQFRKIETHVERINSAVKDMDVLLSHVQNFQKSSKKMDKFNPIDFDIVYCLKSIVENFKVSTKSNLSINEDIKIDKLDIFNDKMMIEYIIRELITNSIKYSGNEVIINTNLYLKDKYIIIEIIDNGFGISTEELPRIREPYFKGKDKVAIQSGLGLGLSTVDKYIKQIKAEIHFESVLNKGTKVTLKILNNSK